MALLKSLIQRLLDSRTTPEEAGHSAMPNSEISITVGDGTSTTFIAPSDGYVFQDVSGASNSNTFSSIIDTYLGLRGQCNSSNGNASRIFLPCRKGDKILCERQGSPKTNVTIKFFATVGGGYLRSFVSAIPKRGKLCLSRLSLFSPRSSFRTNPNGSAIKLCQTIQPSGLFTHLKAHPVNTSHRLTGMSLFTPVAMNGRKSGMETEVSLFQQKVQLTSAFKWLSQRVLKSGTSFKSPWLMVLKKRSLSLFQQLERNTLTGGALC